MKIEERDLREKIVKYLEQFVTESRQERLSEILKNRTRHITVVLEDLFQAQNISAGLFQDLIRDLLGVAAFAFLFLLPGAADPSRVHGILILFIFGNHLRNSKDLSLNVVCVIPVYVSKHIIEVHYDL